MAWLLARLSTSKPGQGEGLGRLRRSFQGVGFVFRLTALGEGAFQVTDPHIGRIQDGLHAGEDDLRAVRQNLIPNRAGKHDIPDCIQGDLKRGGGCGW